ncbi:MAG: glycerol-3-phosphate 1-O-acyltransferase PlsY [Phycisphaerae bacterium]|nr:glycerol-3-phosphate 1-O-acyltransferase PlsY [Phycisphaerae bacterium]
MIIENPVIWFTVFPVLAYIIGATPFGVIIARVHGVDLRKVGSGNVGATNVGRTVGRKWGYFCFLLDLTKGFVPTLLAGLSIGAAGEALPPDGLRQGAWLAVGAACILGHVFNFWLKFRGGKGVATALGVVLGMFPYFTGCGVSAFIVWIVVVRISRYVSLASIVAAAAFLPLFVVWNGLLLGWGQVPGLWPMGTFAAVMAGLIIFLHRGNIRRLLAGEENKIGGDKTKPQNPTPKP